MDSNKIPQQSDEQLNSIEEEFELSADQLNLIAGGEAAPDEEEKLQA